MTASALSRRRPRGLAQLARLSLVVVAVALGGCATLNVVDSDVSSFSQWPADRKASTYAFERLPSQQARPDEQEALENAARPALEKAGFSAAADPARADVVVQLGARTNRVAYGAYDDPWLWRPSLLWYGGPRRSVWGTSIGFGFHDMPRYEREVAVLVRDRQSGQPLYESRASNDGTTLPTASTLAAMFDAALKDFPGPAVNPRRVRIELPK
jgi:hypothetical protein